MELADAVGELRTLINFGFGGRIQAPTEASELPTRQSLQILAECLGSMLHRAGASTTMVCANDVVERHGRKDRTQAAGLSALKQLGIATPVTPSRRHNRHGRGAYFNIDSGRVPSTAEIGAIKASLRSLCGLPIWERRVLKKEAQMLRQLADVMAGSCLLASTEGEAATLVRDYHEGLENHSKKLAEGVQHWSAPDWNDPCGEELEGRTCILPRNHHIAHHFNIRRPHFIRTSHNIYSLVGFLREISIVTAGDAAGFEAIHATGRHSAFARYQQMHPDDMHRVRELVQLAARQGVLPPGTRSAGFTRSASQLGWKDAGTATVG